MSLYMVIENFKNDDAVPVYRRLRDRGRLAPSGVSYVSSWVTDKMDRCYQLMETHDRALLDRWITNWNDIVDFEVHPVITSKGAAERVRPRL
jgi:tRNA splicing endonuclease